MSKRTQYNISPPDLATMFRNWIKGAAITSSGTVIDPSKLDADGYPISSIATTIPLSMSIPTSFQGASEVWVLKCIGSRSITVETNSNAVSVVSSSGGVVTGGSNSAMTVSGSNWRVTFTWGQTRNPRILNLPSTGTYAAGTGTLVLCRLSDEADLDAGDEFLPEYVALITTTLNAATLRWMPVNLSLTGNCPNLNSFAYRSTPTRLSYANSYFVPDLWAGTATGTDQYTVAAATLTDLSGYSAGEMIQFKATNGMSNSPTISGTANNGGKVQLTVNSTALLSNGQAVYVSGLQGTKEANGKQTVLSVDDATHVTLDVDYATAFVSGGGPVVGVATLTVTGKPSGSATKPIINMFGGGVDSSTKFSAGANVTLAYDRILDVWLLLSASSGITPNVPIETMVDFSNKTSCNLWLCIPLLWTPSDAGLASALISGSLNSGLSCYFEPGNEIWNPAFMPTALANNWAIKFGMTTGLVHSTYALLGKMMMDAITTSWGGRSGLKRVLAQQHVNTVKTTRMEGSECVTGNTNYNAFTADASNPEGRSFNTFPDRFVDTADVFATGLYVDAANLRNSPAGWTSREAPALQILADLWNAGNTSAAIAWIDDDIRQGRTNVQTVTVGSGTTFTGSQAYTNGWLVRFTTTGTLPSNIALDTAYFVVNASGNTFQISLTSGGAAITGISGGSGTLSSGRMGGGTAQCLLNHVMVFYPANAALADSYTSQRASIGMLPLSYEPYEGGLEKCDIDSATCDALGLTPSGSGDGSAYRAITDAFAAWIASNSALQYEHDFMSQFDAFTNTSNPAHYYISGPSIWGILEGDFTTSPSQMSEGARLYSSSKRRLVW